MRHYLNTLMNQLDSTPLALASESTSQLLLLASNQYTETLDYLETSLLSLLTRPIGSI